MNSVEIKSKLGTIKGYTKDNINYFRGIPYAKTDRFKKPEPFIFENSYFDATKDEVECPQHSTYYESSLSDFYPHEYYNPSKKYVYDESFLTLNIITPSNKTNLDTLIFIHGGAFTLGCQSNIPYGLSKVYAKKDIILVSLSYRLNVFGSFNSDNLALHDLIFGINWVKDNIESFGGNGRITLSGQSAGAFLIQDLLYSDKLKGIVSGAIMLSGGGIIPYSFGPGNKNRFNRFYKSYMRTMNSKTIDDLNKLSTEELFKSYEDYNNKKNMFFSYLPQVDKDTIKDYPRKLIKNHDTLDIPLIFGITKDDMLPPVLLMMAKNHSKYHYKNNMSDTYMYFFKRESPGDNAKAFHACDLAYVFGLDNIWRPWEEIDYKISDELINYFSNFIHTGNPNGEGLSKWAKAYPSKTLKSFDENLDQMISYKDALKICSKFPIFPKLQDKE